MKKRLLVVFVILLLVFSVIPVAFAAMTSSGKDAEGSVTGEAGGVGAMLTPAEMSAALPSMVAGSNTGGATVGADTVATVGTNSFTSLADAVDAAQNGDTVILQKDITDGTGIIVNGTAGRNFTIDFNGKTYTVTNEFAGSVGTKNQCFQLLKGSAITMKNGTITANSAAIKMIIQNYADLTLEDMTLDAAQGENSVAYALSSNCGKVNLTGATNITAKSGAYAFDACWGPNKGYPEGTQVTVNTTGKISGKVQFDLWGTYAAPCLTTLTITKGNFDGAIEIADLDSDKGNIKITGGTFSVDPSAFVAPKYAAIKGDSAWTVASAPVVIGDKGYATLTEAVTAAQDGDTITLQKSITDGSGVIINGAAERNLTIDFNGKTYTVTNEFAGSDGTKNQCFQVLKGSAITMKNGTITANSAAIKMIIQNYADLTLENVTLDATKGTNSVDYVMSNNCGNVNIIGKTNIIAKDGGHAFDAYYWPQGGKGYTDGVYVTVDTTGRIIGIMERGHDGTDAENFDAKSVITVKNGKFSNLPQALGYAAANANIGVGAAVTLTEDITIPEGMTFTNAGYAFTIGEDVTITNNGTIVNSSGYIQNNGTIAGRGTIENNATIRGHQPQCDIYGSGTVLCDGATAKNYDEFKAAFASGSVTLGSDITLPGQLRFSRNTTIDLNGYTLNCSTKEQFHSNGVFSLTIKDSGKNGKITTSADSLFYISNATLDLQGGIFETTGVKADIITAMGARNPAENYTTVKIGKDAVLSYGGNATDFGCYAIDVLPLSYSAYGVVIDIAGTINAGNKSVDGAAVYVSGNVKNHSLDKPAQINIQDGAVLNGTVYAAGYADWTFGDCTVKGASGIEAKNGTITINNGTYTATGEIQHDPNGNGTSSKGYAVAQVSNSDYGVADITVNGGTFNSPIVRLTDSGSQTGSLNVKGGTFADIASALQYAADNAAIKSAKDMDAGDTQVVVTGNNVTLDLNGKTVTTTADPFLKVAKDASLTIEDSVGGGTLYEKRDYSYLVKNEGTLTIENGTFKALSEVYYPGENQMYGTFALAMSKDSVTTINGGDFIGALYTNGTSENVTINFNGGTFRDMLYLAAKTVSVNITDGTFNGGMETKGSTFHISGGTFNAANVEPKQEADNNGSSTNGGWALAVVDNPGYGEVNATITGGTFNGPVALLDDDADTANNNDTLSIKGGTYDDLGVLAYAAGTADAKSAITIDNVVATIADGKTLNIPENAQVTLGEQTKITLATGKDQIVIPVSSSLTKNGTMVLPSVTVDSSVTGEKATASLSDVPVADDAANNEVTFLATSGDSAAEVKASEVTIPNTATDALKDAKAVTIETDVASVTMNNALLKAVDAAAGESSEVKLEVKKLDTLPSGVPAGSVALELNLKTDGAAENIDFGTHGEATISFIYTGDVPEGQTVAVYYVDDNGKLSKVDGTYDKGTKLVTFTTSHFSTYVGQAEPGDLEKYTMTMDIPKDHYDVGDRFTATITVKPTVLSVEKTVFTSFKFDLDVPAGYTITNLVTPLDTINNLWYISQDYKTGGYDVYGSTPIEVPQSGCVIAEVSFEVTSATGSNAISFTEGAVTYPNELSSETNLYGDTATLHDIQVTMTSGTTANYGTDDSDQVYYAKYDKAGLYSDAARTASVSTLPGLTPEAGYRLANKTGENLWSDGANTYADNAAVLAAAWTENKTLTAQTVETPTITFAVEGNGSLSSSDSIVVDKGTTLSAVTLPTPAPVDNYQFDGWYIGDTNVSSGYVVNSSITLTAKFVPENYGWSQTLNNATISALTGVVNSKVTYNTAVTFKAAAKDGYDISKVTYTVGNGTPTELTADGDGVYTIPGNVITDAVAITIETVATHTVTFTAEENANGTVSGGPFTINNGNTLTAEQLGLVTTAPNADYAFEKWYTDIETKEAVDPTTVTINTDTTFYAYFKHGAYAVTFPEGVTGIESTSTNGTDFTFTPQKAGSVITGVTVTIGEAAYTGFSENADGSYTIPGADITGNIAITVDALQGNIQFIDKATYVALADGTKIAALRTAKLENNHYMFGDKDMYFSAQYDEADFTVDGCGMQSYLVIVPDTTTDAQIAQKLVVADAAATEIVYGDLNGDTKITPADGGLINSILFAAYNYAPTDLQRLQADISGNKTVNRNDMVNILETYVGNPLTSDL